AVVPGLNEVVHGSTCATSSRSRVNACSSFVCFTDEPKKIRGLSIYSPGAGPRHLWRLSMASDVIGTGLPGQYPSPSQVSETAGCFPEGTDPAFAVTICGRDVLLLNSVSTTKP